MSAELLKNLEARLVRPRWHKFNLRYVNLYKIEDNTPEFQLICLALCKRKLQVEASEFDIPRAQFSGDTVVTIRQE